MLSRVANFPSQIADAVELALIRAAGNGDSRAFAKLVSKYERRLRFLGMRFFKNDTDCDDFVQEVFIKVFTGLHSFKGDSQFSTWLMRIAYNTAVNTINRRKEYLSFPENYEILDTTTDPEEKHLKNMTAQVIRDSISELPEKFSMCLIFYFYYDMSYNEISVITDLPVNTIKSHVFRAKKILKDKLSEQLA
ncbi:MAG: sigma-70 family RNA polymerase sigma factor [Spirochaetaceae bacterium]|nr:sigma-70 family RNA polymerase sigma factor [Spirochaetaceae bacterium]